MYYFYKKTNTNYMKKYMFISFLILVFTVFSIKLGTILSNFSYYEKVLEEKTNIYIEGASSPRGRILDTNGKVLVDNIGVKTIYYNKIKGITTEKELDIASKLATILNIEYANNMELKKYYLVINNNGKDLITSDEYTLYEERKLSSEAIDKLKLERITEDMINYDDFIKEVAHIYSLMNEGYIYSKKEILKDVSEEEYAKVIESNISGVTGEITWERVYPYENTLRNIFGSVGSITKENKEYYLSNGYLLTDTVGISYLELQYENYLKGEKALYKVDSNYNLIKVKEEKKGSDLVLSIDIDLQMKVESILEEKIIQGKKYGNTEYFTESYALVGNPLTGAILAISGKRLNQDNTFSDVSLNAINKSYTMGSSVKGATIAVGYKYNLITPGAYVVDSCVKLKSVPQKCSFKSLGKVNDLTALAYSSNYYQYLIAINLTGNSYVANMKLNATKEHFDIYRNMLANFGLGVKTEIDLPNENIGIKGSKIADDLLLNLSIGQYDTYTPLQLLQYINTIASGKRIALSLMKEIDDADKTIFQNKVNVLNEVDLDFKYLDRIREGLKLVLKEGTGKFYVPQGLDFVGKTGTSESFLDTNNDNAVDTATISSVFTGYYPIDNPKYSIVVLAPHISHKNGKTDAFYYGASRITKDIVNYLNE